jgi:hypothetical protein
MPTLAQMVIPLSASWSEFEDIARSSFKVRWKSPNLQRNGRGGQRQYGVDIHGPDHLAQTVGIQCKKVEKLTIKEIKKEIAEADAADPKVKALYIATSLPRDAKLFQAVRKLSEARIAAGHFPVGIFFWEDIYEELVGDLAEFGKHYPDFVPKHYARPSPAEYAEAVKHKLVAKEAFDASQSIYALAHNLMSGMNVRPDIEWSEVLEFVAWDFERREKELDAILAKYGAIVGDDVRALLQKAYGLCSKGKHLIYYEDSEPIVPDEAIKTAEELVTTMNEAADKSREWIQKQSQGK